VSTKNHHLCPTPQKADPGLQPPLSDPITAAVHTSAADTATANTAANLVVIIFIAITIGVFFLWLPPLLVDC
jgi:hypothetical protein